MSGGAPILCPEPDCDIGMLEDYHPAHERDDVPDDTGYVGHCSEGCGSYYLSNPVPLSEIEPNRTSIFPPDPGSVSASIDAELCDFCDRTALVAGRCELHGGG